MRELQNIMQMEGSGGGPGGLAGDGVLRDPDGRLALRLKRNIASNPNYVEGTISYS